MRDTLKQKYLFMLADLKKERKDPENEEWWNYRLDRMIADLSAICVQRGYVK